MKKNLTLALAAIGLGSAIGLAIDRSNYIQPGPGGMELIEKLPSWQAGQKWCDDDNFYISRVRIKPRFRNRATQVLDWLDASNDKNLIYWVPIGTPPYNGNPVGYYDGDVFSMWQYVTHYGNWSASLGRCPGNFTDVAHKNGVGVSTIVSTPYGQLGERWARTLTTMTDNGPEIMSEYMNYYGLNGVGYNSEFQYPEKMYEGVPENLVERMVEYNAYLLKNANAPGAAFANIWYDGTSIDGQIMFDQGLAAHNIPTFGTGEKPATQLFTNYNWNRTDLDGMLETAKKIGRNPLDIYCGFNMQGKEPSPANPVWTLMKKYPFSIGLWGAHSESMMYESRNENGASVDKHQETYLLRNERFFTGGTRNPVNCPEIVDDWGYGAGNTWFFGMSSFMSARSSLGWNLDDEPFITHFNLGNGKFFNWMGERADNDEWCNIGVQDYMPTWRWWWTDKFLGRNPSDVPQKGLEANFIWTDAYLGGSTINISGTHPKEYLHLFKTQYELKADDEISFTYRVIDGTTQLRLALSVEGAEDKEVLSPQFVTPAKCNQQWQTVTFQIGRDFPELTGKTLAMIALQFEYANKLNMNLGRLSLSRPGAATEVPSKPEIEKAEILAFDKTGVDAKVIFNMPNQITDRVCYNDDVNTSLFKIYYQQEGCDPRLKTITTSWAAILYSAALQPETDAKMRIGVSALSMDMKSESPIEWSEYMDCSSFYTPDYSIKLSTTEPFVSEPFEVLLADPYLSADLNWSIKDNSGKEVATGRGNSLEVKEGIKNAGNYNIEISDGADIHYVYNGILPILPATSARSPKIENVQFQALDYADAEDKNISGDHDIVTLQEFALNYEGRKADGLRSRGLHIEGYGFGMKAKEVGFNNQTPISISFWFCPENLDGLAQVISLRDKTNTWPKNEYGMFRQVYNPSTRQLITYVTYKQIIEATYELVFDNVDLPEGSWSHFAYSFEFDKSKKLTFRMALNGKVLVPSSWKFADESGTGHCDKMGPMPTMTQYHVLAIGGALHKNGGLEGKLDDVMFFDKALTEKELEDSYLAEGIYNPDNTLLLYFDFENDADSEHVFKSAVETEITAGAGVIMYVADFEEGKGNGVWVKPNYTSGAPMTSSNREIKTVAKWSVPCSVLTQESGNDTNGEARGHFSKAGNFRAVLTLTNDCGSDTREFDFVKVVEGVHVNAVKEDNTGLLSYQFEGDQLLLWLTGNKATNASLYQLDGTCLISPTNIDIATSPCSLKMPFPKGIYILRLQTPGEKEVTIKLNKTR